MSHYHAVAFIDHAQARIFLFDEETEEARTVHAADGHPHLHHKHGSPSGHRSPADERYLHAIVESLKDAQAWLIVGPGDAKGQFVRHVEAHDHALKGRIAGVETVDHPTDGQLLALARHRFKALDRLTPQR